MVPWFEFGGECVVECAKSGHSAKIIFHAKVRLLAHVSCQGGVICIELKCVHPFIT